MIISVAWWRNIRQSLRLGLTEEYQAETNSSGHAPICTKYYMSQERPMNWCVETQTFMGTLYKLHDETVCCTLFQGQIRTQNACLTTRPYARDILWSNGYKTIFLVYTRFLCAESFVSRSETYKVSRMLSSCVRVSPLSPGCQGPENCLGADIIPNFR